MSADKIEPRSVELHAVATFVGAFVVPVDEIRTSAGLLLDPDKHPSGLVIGLDIHAETADGDRQFGIVLGPAIDPTELAGELEGLAVTIIRRHAIDLGFDKIEADRQARMIARRSRIESRADVATDAPQNLTCDYCSRSVAIIYTNEDGESVRVCKRHAEQLGVRPRGKIGGES